ncbi:MAG: hypothetical protein CBARDCOR_1269 [uncultured Caballeronia sp.]|nr:MAG: hypothetical protein CBARDCOR_1269 [uncultured Caballeronia sp.]
MLLAVCCVTVALIGRVASGFVPKTAALQPDLKINWNPSVRPGVTSPGVTSRSHARTGPCS